MLIALDYDGTYDQDTFAWDSFILLMHSRGHRVVIVTYRDERYDMTGALSILNFRIPTYFTRGVAKAFWMEQFAPPEDAFPDVWIDDKPKTINANSGLNREALAKWREEQTMKDTTPSS